MEGFEVFLWIGYVVWFFVDFVLDVVLLGIMGVLCGLVELVV